jgi:RimJ/RimL family protein N-acetyltransferase
MSHQAEPETLYPEFPNLKTHRLILRQFGPADAEALFKACQDPDIDPLIFVQRDMPSHVSEVQPYPIEYAANAWRRNKRYAFGVFTLDGKRLVSTWYISGPTL